MISSAITHWTVLKISFEERLIYRGDFALGTVMRFLPIITQIFLWTAVFAARAVANPDEPEIVGYTRDSMIAYYLLTMISRAFSSMPGLASSIASDIRDGTVKKYLIQPIDMVSFLLVNRMAHKLVYYLVALVPFAFLFFVCRGFFVGWPDAWTLAAYLASLAMAFLLGFFLEATLGMIGFWFLEVNSLFFIYMLFNFFFSGHMFPLDLLPGVWQDLVRLMPLQYLAYFPAAVFLGKLSQAELVQGLWVQLAWVAFFFATARGAFHFGVRRYSGYGG